MCSSCILKSPGQQGAQEGAQESAQESAQERSLRSLREQHLEGICLEDELELGTKFQGSLESQGQDNFKTPPTFEYYSKMKVF